MIEMLDILKLQRMLCDPGVLPFFREQGEYSTGRWVWRTWSPIWPQRYYTGDAAGLTPDVARTNYLELVLLPTVPTLEGQMGKSPIPSLLGQLREAIHQGIESAGVRASAELKLPLSADAYDLFADIEKESAEQLQIFDRSGHARTTPEGNIRGWNAKLMDATDEALSDAQKIMSRWVRDIENLFDPPRQLELVAPCPHCGHRSIYRRDKAGEIIRAQVWKFAESRQLDGTKKTLSVECLNCHATWDRERFDFLAKMIGSKTAQELIDSETAARKPVKASR